MLLIAIRLCPQPHATSGNASDVRLGMSVDLARERHKLRDLCAGERRHRAVYSPTDTFPFLTSRVRAHLVRPPEPTKPKTHLGPQAS